jgi:VIT1/CCC1 family predicted Fe2+/Mn2+ transporter
MVRHKLHMEHHFVRRLGWLRAAVLGANDGILSTSSLIIGVATAHGSHNAILIAGVSGLVAGAMSMAAGEYVSVSSQADSERADIGRERQELIDNPANELKELAGIYVRRGLTKTLAHQVAEELMAQDALGSHTRDELGISDMTVARPTQAAFASAAAFSGGAAFPLMVLIVTSSNWLVEAVSLGSIMFLAVLGVLGAKLGGADMLRAAIRVTFWGALAMAVTAGIGAIVGTQV